MNVKELINHLRNCDPELEVRLVIPTMEEEGWDENYWVSSLEVHDTGSSGYEFGGEVIIGGSE